MTNHFGPFQLDADRRELLRGGEPVSITAKVFDILVVLVESRGRVVEKSELLSRVWRDSVVEEATLVQTVSMLRKALGCGRVGGQRYIATIPGRGYQFVAEISPPEVTREGGPQPPVPAPPPIKKRRVPGWSVALLVLAGAFLAGWLLRSAPETGPPSHQRPKPLTSYPGREIFPTFSPDGDRVAFIWEGESRDNWDIYVKQVGQDGESRLTEHPARDWSPAWSPDGKLIAFVRQDRDGGTGETIVIPSIGGPERVVRRGPVVRASGIWNGQSRLVGWHPDSEHLIVSHAEEFGREFFLYAVSVKTGRMWRLTDSDNKIDGDLDPAVSPDGKRLAFRRKVSSWTYSVYVVDLTDDLQTTVEPRKVSDGMFSPEWTPDGRELVMVESEMRPRMWRVAVDQAEPHPIRDPAEAAFPTMSPAGNRAAFSVIRVNINIWEARLRGDPNPKPLIASTYVDGVQAISPDGRRIVFTSLRSGSSEIWVSDRDGSNALQLTDHGGVAGAECPNWSPDSSKIAYQADEGNFRDIFVMDATGGTPQRLTHSEALGGAPAWSRDGAWIYFSSNRSGDRSIWKIPSGGGEATRVTTGVSDVYAEESFDGQTLFIEDQLALWSMPVTGGPRSRLLERTWQPTNWETAAAGIYFLEDHSLKFYDFESKVVSEVFATPGPTSFGLSIAPDSETVLFTRRVPEEANIMIVDEFR